EKPRMKEVKKVGRPRSTAEGGKNYTFYLSREVGEKVKELGGARWIRDQAYKAMGKKEKLKN
uniref:hypothetical protein n=2 Tax=Sutterellaceae TaxID=995019 RepID=UPI003A8DDF7D